MGLGLTGFVELLLALFTGSVALLGDALHNLSDVSTSAVVFWGFRVSRKRPNDRYPYGYDRAEDLAGLGIAMVIWASAAFAGIESVRKLLGHDHTTGVSVGIAGAVLGIVGNQLVARYKLRVGRRINSATLIADAKHSWLDALSSSAALVGLVLVAAGLPWGDPVAGLAVTVFIVHVGYEVTADVVHRLMDGADPDELDTARRAALTVDGIRDVTVRGRWTGRTLHLEVAADVDPTLTISQTDALGHTVTRVLTHALDTTPEIIWTARAATTSHAA